MTETPQCPAKPEQSRNRSGWTSEWSSPESSLHLISPKLQKLTLSTILFRENENHDSKIL
jgi:hypothetical protein